MTDLRVEEYDQAEESAIATAPNRVVQAFQPITFRQMGYPHRVDREIQLFKYIDAMNEHEFESHFSRLGGLSIDEFDLVKRLTRLVCEFSEAKFEKKAIARSGVMGALSILRHIRYIFGEERPAVFEIGPGSGYLGAMLMLEGYPYIATEVTQAFYLYQNHLWNYISGGNLLELAHPKHSIEEIFLPVPGSAVHVPWWELVRLRPDLVPGFDIVTCNRVLSEMQEQSLGLVMKISSAALCKPDTPQAFVFDGWGSDAHGGTPPDVVTEIFYGAGFGLVHADSVIRVMTPRVMEYGKGWLRLPDRRIKTRLILRARNLFRNWAGFPSLQRSSLYRHSEYASATNPLSNAIILGRKSGERTRIVGLNQLNGFYTELLGKDVHLSPDERFQTVYLWSESTGFREPTLTSNEAWPERD